MHPYLLLLVILDRLVLQHLSKAGTYEQQQVCSQQLEEVRSSLRFVKYELGRKGQQDADTALPTPVDDIKVDHSAVS